MIFLDGVYIDGAAESRVRFRWVKAPTSDELNQLTHTIAQRIEYFDSSIRHRVSGSASSGKEHAAT